MSVILLILGLVLFLGLVVLHEFGHFMLARRGGVEVQEFGIGFPPRLIKKRMRGGWIFSINLLPLGGFVRLKGEHDTDSEPGSLGSATIFTKVSIMVAGVGMNLVTAYVLLVGLALVGVPQIVDNQFVIKQDASYLQRAQKYVVADQVETGSPAADAGIKLGDTLLSIGFPNHLTHVYSADALPGLTRQYAGETVQVGFQRGGNTGAVITRLVTLRTLADVQAAEAAGRHIGYLGLSAYQAQSGISVVRSSWSAPIVAAGLIKQFSVLTFEGLGKAISGLGSIIAGEATGNVRARQAGQTEASSQVAGPVGIFFIFKYGSTLGLRFILMIVALLSLTLAIMNILPIPALDGGRLWLMLFTRAIRRPLSAQREELINAAGFAFLMGLVILITVVDVKRFF